MSAAVEHINERSIEMDDESIADLREFARHARYTAFAVSYSHIETVKQHITTQADHHRTVTFQEEFPAFPRRLDLEVSWLSYPPLVLSASGGSPSLCPVPGLLVLWRRLDLDTRGGTAAPGY